MFTDSAIKQVTSSQIPDLSQTLCDLLSPKKACVWIQCQDITFKNVKREMTKLVALPLYDPTVEMKRCADSSTCGPGAVFQQVNNRTIGKLSPTHLGL